MELYAVRERRGGGPWNWALGLREQADFDHHARFMDGLVEAGFVVLDGLHQAAGTRSAGEAGRA